MDKPSRIKTFKDMIAHFGACLRRRYGKFDGLNIVADMYGIPISLQSQKDFWGLVTLTL